MAAPSPRKLSPNEVAANQATQLAGFLAESAKAQNVPGVPSATVPASVMGAVNTYVYAVGRILPYHLNRAKANVKAIRAAVR